MGITDEVDHGPKVSRETIDRKQTERDRFIRDKINELGALLAPFGSEYLGFLGVYYFSQTRPGTYQFIPLLSHDHIPYGIVGEGMKALSKKTLEAFKLQIEKEQDSLK